MSQNQDNDYEKITKIEKQTTTTSLFQVEVTHTGNQLSFHNVFNLSPIRNLNTDYKINLIKSNSKTEDVEVVYERSAAHKKIENKIAKKIVFDVMKEIGYPRIKTNAPDPPSDQAACRIFCTWAKSWRNRTSDAIFDIRLLQVPRHKAYGATNLKIYSEDGSFNVTWDYFSFQPDRTINYWQNKSKFEYSHKIPFADPNLSQTLGETIKRINKAMVFANQKYVEKQKDKLFYYHDSALRLTPDEYQQLLKILND